MVSNSLSHWTIPVAVTLLILAPRTARPQELHLGIGYSSYDLSGTGSTTVGVAGYTHPLTGPLHAEIGATYFGYDTQFGDAAKYLFPEATLVLKPRGGVVRPFVGAGAGITVAFAGGGGGSLTLHAATGVDVGGPRWGVRGEFRVRAVDPWGAVTADLTIGPAMRF